MNWKYVIGGIATIAALTFVVWFIFFRSAPSQTQTPTTTSGVFGSSSNQPIPTISNSAIKPEGRGTFVYTPTQKKVFLIAEGPVASAVFTQTHNPTTTSVRYVRQDSGHVFEQSLDTSGSAARAISNTTIPGIANAIWTQGGSSIILQYAENSTIKSVSVGFQPAGTSTQGAGLTAPLRFLPDNISSITASPDGLSVAYLLRTPTGSDGYIANYDGTNSVKLFSIPLSQLRLMWPSRNQLLLESKTAAGVQGMAFSVSIKTGVYTQLLYTTGLSAIANGDFSSVVYQTDVSGKRNSYEHNTASGVDTKLSGQPIPEKCAWSYVVRAVLICAVPNSYVPLNYLDLWHQGLAGVADTLVGYNFDTKADVAIATPGDKDGGVKSDIASVTVSPNGDYLLYITRGDHAVWGVHLTQ